MIKNSINLSYKVYSANFKILNLGNFVEHLELILEPFIVFREILEF